MLVCKIEQLTDKQMEVLDMVLKHMSSKQIARKLGISHKSVDRRIDAARVKLGAPTRREAARIFGEAYYGGSFPLEALPQTPEARCHESTPRGSHDGGETSSSISDHIASRQRSALRLDPKTIAPAERLRLILVGALAVSLFLLTGLGIANGLQTFLMRWMDHGCPRVENRNLEYEMVGIPGSTTRLGAAVLHAEEPIDQADI